MFGSDTVPVTLLTLQHYTSVQTVHWQFNDLPRSNGNDEMMVINCRNTGVYTNSCVVNFTVLFLLAEIQ